MGLESRQEYERRGSVGELSEPDRDERPRKPSFRPAGGDVLVGGSGDGGECGREETRAGFRLVSDTSSSSTDASADTSLSAL